MSLSTQTSLVLSLVLGFSLLHPAHADPIPQPTEPPEDEENADAPQASHRAFSTSFHMSPLVLLGGIAGSVEQQVFEAHTLQVGVGWTGYGISQGVEVGTNYRLYLGAPMNSSFVGAFVLYGDIETESEFGEGDKTHLVGVRFLRLGLNYGRRWVFGPGFSVVLRGGYGYPIRTFDWIAPAPSKAEQRDFETLLGWLLGIDAEASIGWTF